MINQRMAQAFLKVAAEETTDVKQKRKMPVDIIKMKSDWFQNVESC